MILSNSPNSLPSGDIRIPKNHTPNNVAHNSLDSMSRFITLVKSWGILGIRMLFRQVCWVWFLSRHGCKLDEICWNVLKYTEAYVSILSSTIIECTWSIGILQVHIAPSTIHLPCHSIMPQWYATGASTQRGSHSGAQKGRVQGAPWGRVWHSMT